MTWDKKLNVAILGFLLLTGCAQGPERTGGQGEIAVANEASEALLQEAYTKAVALMENGDIEQAKSRFEQMSVEHPHRTGPTANLGVLAFQAGESKLAKAWFEKVLTLNPNHLVALNHLGVIARNAGDFTKAEQRYREALSANPEYVPALLNLAFLLDIYLGEPEQALPLYEQYKALVAEPDPKLKDWMFDAKNRI